MKKVSALRYTLLISILLAAASTLATAQSSCWFCPACGTSEISGAVCPTCGHAEPAGGILYFDDMKSESPAGRWCVKELKDKETSGLGIDGVFKTEYSGQPSALYETRQGCMVIGSTSVKSKDTWTRISWDAFHKHSSEITEVTEGIEYGTLQPAIDGHAVFVPDNFKIEFDMYLFTPASGSRKDSNEDCCSVSFCGHAFMINTWGSDYYDMGLAGGGFPAVKVTKPGWRHFELLFEDGHASLLLDGGKIAGSPAQHRTEGTITSDFILAQIQSSSASRTSRFQS